MNHETTLAQGQVECRVMRRVVCAAIRNTNSEVICGPRHFDHTMRKQIAASGAHAWDRAEQGFVDQRGDWLTREEAWVIAEAAGQIIRRVGGDGVRLFSENLY